VRSGVARVNEATSGVTVKSLPVFLHCVEVLPAGDTIDDDVKYLVRRVDGVDKDASAPYYTCVQFIRRSPEVVRRLPKVI